MSHQKDSPIPTATRRDFLAAGVASIIAAAAGAFTATSASTAETSATPRSHLHKTVKALVFDVFGTVVDWRGRTNLEPGAKQTPQQTAKVSWM